MPRCIKEAEAKMAERQRRFDSPTYPYERVESGYNTMRGSEKIPLQILSYLMDLPDANGYVPVDDNDRPRVRLAKYLFYDGANPLRQPLPTPEQKMSLLFNGEEPVLNTDEQKEKHPKGYRLYPQMYWGQSQLEAQATLKCFLGRVNPTSPFAAKIGLVFEILVNVNQENTTRTDAYSRAYNMEQCIVEALNGVNITGVGVVEFARNSYYESGSRAIADSGTNVGRELNMSIDWMESEEVPR